MKLGDYLRRKREALGWTQPEAAAKAGIEQSYLSKIESGRSVPSPDVFQKLVQALGIETEVLVAELDPLEIERLQDLKPIAQSDQLSKRQIFRARRRWLVATLLFFGLSGTSFGLFRLAETEIYRSFQYVSLGVLKEDEPIRAFEIVNSNYEPQDSRYTRQQEMTRRLDPLRRTISEERGDWFIEPVDNGRRLFELRDVDTVQQKSWHAWFFVPALGFLAAGFASAFISFRWK
ncbi:MAG: hypothetical protein CMK09_17045 [Ponticaulis sp.]|nr:hypothetical protein [Ponticaulis sp.]